MARFCVPANDTTEVTVTIKTGTVSNGEYILAVNEAIVTAPSGGTITTTTVGVIEAEVSMNVTAITSDIDNITVSLT